VVGLQWPEAGVARDGAYGWQAIPESVIAENRKGADIEKFKAGK